MRISDIAVIVVAVVGGRRASTVNTNTPFLILFTMKLKCVDRMQMLVRVDWEKESGDKFPRTKREITEEKKLNEIKLICLRRSERQKNECTRIDELNAREHSEWVKYFSLCVWRRKKRAECLLHLHIFTDWMPCAMRHTRRQIFKFE